MTSPLFYRIINTDNKKKEYAMKRVIIRLLILSAILLLTLSGCFRAETVPQESTAGDTLSSIPPETPAETAAVIPETTPEETTKTTVPETTVPETTAPETTAPETTVPETTAPVTTAPETTVPQTEAPVTAAPAEGDGPTLTVDEVGCTFVNGILIANKTYALPKEYAPGMDEEAYKHLSDMFTDAKAAGYTLRVASSYRSYIDQYIIYNDYVKRDGQAAADRYSARPGHSEQQSGLAFDLKCPTYDGLTTAFADMPEGIWVAENCHKYGFIIRYPKDKEEITGYMYEPWHVRYLGVDTATAVVESGLCLEEYLGITSKYAE